MPLPTVAELNPRPGPLRPGKAQPVMPESARCPSTALRSELVVRKKRSVMIFRGGGSSPSAVSPTPDTCFGSASERPGSAPTHQFPHSFAHHARQSIPHHQGSPQSELTVHRKRSSIATSNQENLTPERRRISKHRYLNRLASGFLEVPVTRTSSELREFIDAFPQPPSTSPPSSRSTSYVSTSAQTDIGDLPIITATKPVGNDHAIRQRLPAINGRPVREISVSIVTEQERFTYD